MSIHAEQVKNKFENRIVSLLNSIRDRVNELHAINPQKNIWFADESVVEVSDNEYKWQLFIQKSKDDVDHSISVSFTIVERLVRQDNKLGFTFGLGASNFEGEILLNIFRANFTNDIWLDDMDQLESRFQYYEDIDINDMTESLLDNATKSYLDDLQPQLFVQI